MNAGSITDPLRVVVLISGRGSNFVNLVEQSSGYTVVGVVSNRLDAGGLRKAEEFKIPTSVVLRKDFKTKQAYQEELAHVVGSYRPDIVALAGFMEIVREPFLAAFPGRIINIHPSLLPAYPGLDTHSRALKAKETYHGCSVHMVDAGVDTGPLIAQATCKVHLEDSVDDLAQQVLVREHALYPWVLNMIATGHIVLQKAGTEYSETACAEAREMNFLLP
jgi:phosphoribosylglycinamide formyltransferase 1